MDPDKDEIRVLVPRESASAFARQLTRRQSLALAGAGVVGSLLSGCGVSSQKSAAGAPTSGKKLESQILIGNWPDYTDPATYKQFTQHVGPKVVLSQYSSNNEILAKLNAGGTRYDIVVPANFMVKILVDKGLALRLNHDLIPNLKYLRPAFRNMIYDPGNRYSVPKDYGITSFFYRTAVVKERPQTYLDVFKLLPKYKGRNINFLAEPSDISEVTLAALGKRTGTVSDADFAAAKALLLKVRPAITTFNTSYLDPASAGKIDIGMAYTGDASRIIDARKKAGDEVIYLVPKTDGVYFVDNWLIPANAPDPVAAHRWLNFLLQPAVAGQEWNYMNYPVPVIGLQKYVTPALYKAPYISVPDSVLATYQSTLQSPKRVQLGVQLYNQVVNA